MMGLGKGKDEVFDFQLTDEEFAATRDRLPDRVRNSQRRDGITARTNGYRKAAAALRVENDFRREYIEAMQMEKKIADLEGEESDVERLRKENVSLRSENSDLRAITELRNADAQAIAERAQSARAVHSEVDR